VEAEQGPQEKEDQWHQVKKRESMEKMNQHNIPNTILQ
jgi:hypothetical protein